MINMKELIECGRVADVLLGRGECFVQSRFLAGHDYLSALYWLNKVAIEKGTSQEYVAYIECAFDCLLADNNNEAAANFITALYAAMQERNWSIPIKFVTFARKFSPHMDSVSLADEFRDVLRSALTS
jgi:hypothetical protein